MKYEKGDRFIIEIDDVMESRNTNGEPRYVYRMKPFNTLVMDEYGLDRLTKMDNDEPVTAEEVMKAPDAPPIPRERVIWKGEDEAIYLDILTGDVRWEKEFRTGGE